MLFNLSLKCRVLFARNIRCFLSLTTKSATFFFNPCATQYLNSASRPCRAKLQPSLPIQTVQSLIQSFLPPLPPPPAADLFVTKTIASPYYLEMQEGDKVDIIDILEDNSSVIIRTADERVGYYNLDFLATADEVRDANRAPG